MTAPASRVEPLADVLVRGGDGRSAQAVDEAAWRFHRGLGSYAPAPLLDAPVLAARLGIGQLWIKLEGERLGLGSYKALGAFYAGFRLMARELEMDAAGAGAYARVGEAARRAKLRLVAPTDGNHGRAVARLARLHGLGARIFFPAGTAPARLDDARAEGADVVVVDGTYVDAYHAAAAEAGDGVLLVTDFAVTGSEASPRWVIDAYAPVQRRPAVITVEPSNAACVLASLRRDAVSAVPGPHRSVMAGLNCDAPSAAAWPDLRAGVSVASAIDDAAARWAVRALHAHGVSAGESGASGLAGLAALCWSEPPGPVPLDRYARVLAIVTEGITDPAAHAASLDARLDGWPEPSPDG